MKKSATSEEQKYNRSLWLTRGYFFREVARSDEHKSSLRHLFLYTLHKLTDGISAVQLTDYSMTCNSFFLPSTIYEAYSGQSISTAHTIVTYGTERRLSTATQGTTRRQCYWNSIKIPHAQHVTNETMLTGPVISWPRSCQPLTVGLQQRLNP